MSNAEFKVEPLEAMRMLDTVFADTHPPAEAELKKFRAQLRRCYDGTEGVEFFQGLASGLRMMQTYALEDIEHQTLRSRSFLRASGTYYEALREYIEAMERGLTKSSAD